MTQPLLELLSELLDAAEQTDDFVTGVVGLTTGRLGGDTVQGQSWLARRLSVLGSRFQLGKGFVAQGFGAAYGPEQLRKAAVEAEHVVSALDELSASGECPGLVVRLDELGVRRIPQELSAFQLRSPELHDLHDRLARASGAIRETRTRLLLDRRRSGGAP